MTEPTRTQGGQLLTDLMLDLFRLHGRVIASGDRLVADLGLTSARWQVLGAIAVAQRPQPVAWLARDLGANRQNIQRIVNDLEAAGLVAFAPNPHHRRAQLVVLTKEGREAFDAAMRLQAPWVERLAEGLAVEELQTVHRVLVDLRQKLEGDGA
jgi:DNA-binding MarR family transcriptional regulator